MEDLMGNSWDRTFINGLCMEKETCSFNRWIYPVNGYMDVEKPGGFSAELGQWAIFMVGKLHS